MKAQCLPPDRISNLPLSIIQTILTLMPIRDAFRTSILSRKWRYNCKNIPKLDFDDKQLKESTDFQLSDKFKIFHVVYHVLLLHNVPVLEFSLCLSKLESCYEIDGIILHLSRNTTIEKFTLCMGWSGYYYKLPSSFFSLQKLTHLKLQYCKIEPLLTIIGFSTLTSLWFDTVSISTDTLLRLLCNCSLLKSFTLIGDIVNVNFVELFRCLPLIEHLHMDSYSVQSFSTEDIFRWQFRNMLVHLKVLQLSELSIDQEYDLRLVLLLITSSPNIEKLKLEMNYDRNEAISETAMYLVDLHEHDYSYVILDNLHEMEITNFSNKHKPEMDFVKLILTKSPMLKTVRIMIKETISVNDEVKMLRDLLWFPRASTGAQIKFERS